MDIVGLARRETTHTIDCGADLRLRLSVAPPLDRAPPSFVLYMLDPDPELFALACVTTGQLTTDSTPGHQPFSPRLMPR